MTSTELYSTIDSMIERGSSFALWRIPGEARIHLRVQTEGEPRLLYDVKELNLRGGFIIAPFCVSDRHPIVVIDQARAEVIPIQADGASPSFRPVEGERPFPVSDEWDCRRYAACFHKFLDALTSGEQEKLVLSRQKETVRPAGVSIGEAFRRAVERYIYSYVYLCHTPATGTWMGSTPEILLAGRHGAWQTVALAGTQRLDHGRVPTEWDAKNRREQQLVADYIHAQLRTLGIGARTVGPYPARAGELSHLKTEFHFSLPDERRIGEVLDLLHPTPAVCGLPKEKAYDFILRHEGYDRAYYSGFVGLLDPEGETSLYVNLRCVHIQPSKFTFYAGGGLLASSSLDEEWRETGDKMGTMGRTVAIDNGQWTMDNGGMNPN